MIAIIVGIGVVICILGLAYFVQGPPYVASTDSNAAEIAHLAQRYQARRVLDMGSGDGALLIKLTEAGLSADGIELNPWLVWRSRRRLRRLGMTDVRVYWANFWRYDISSYDTVVLYAVTHVMTRLEYKLQTELQPGSHVISNYFQLPTLPVITETDRLHVYQISKEDV